MTHTEGQRKSFDPNFQNPQTSLPPNQSSHRKQIERQTIAAMRNRCEAQTQRSCTNGPWVPLRSLHPPGPPWCPLVPPGAFWCPLPLAPVSPVGPSLLPLCRAALASVGLVPRGSLPAPPLSCCTAKRWPYAPLQQTSAHCTHCPGSTQQTISRNPNTNVVCIPCTTLKKYKKKQKHGKRQRP